MIKSLKYYITLGGIEYPASDTCIALDTLGGVGYYQNGTAPGIKLCQTDITLINMLAG